MNIEVDLTLEKECWNCNGAGKLKVGKLKANNSARPYFKEDGMCSLCRGTGHQPTVYGDDLLKFLRRHLKPECFKHEEQE